MIVCIDTNALLPILSLSHRWGVILDVWIDGRFVWAVSTDILAEYEELIVSRMGAKRWQDFVRLLEVVETLHHNLVRSSPSFQFHVMTGDPDDDKFSDCAIVSDADFIVTEDRHFDVLNGSVYKPRPLAPGEFLIRLMT